MLTANLVELLRPQSVPPAGAAQEYRLNPFDPLDQEKSNWCWAATSAMIFNFYEQTALKPCEWASRRHETPHDCCHIASSCNIPRPIGQALGPLHREPVTRGLPDPTAIEQEIRAPDGGRALVWIQYIREGTKKGLIHFVPVYGIGRDSSGRSFIRWVEPIGGRERRSLLSSKIGFRSWLGTAWTKREED